MVLIDDIDMTTIDVGDVFDGDDGRRSYPFNWSRFI